MRSSSENTGGLDAVERGRTIDPGFESVLAFEFYDGAESGLAVYESGNGVRFSSLGDSQSGQFRAFELCSIAGNWRERVEDCKTKSGAKQPGRFVLPNVMSEALSRLERDVAAAQAQRFFLGVGSPYLEQLAVVEVSLGELEGVRCEKSSTSAFAHAHRIVKSRRE